MTVIGLGSPDEVCVQFSPSQRHVLVEILRAKRAITTRNAVSVYESTPAACTRPIDDCHDQLRAIDALLIQLDEQPASAQATLIGDTDLIRSVVHGSTGAAVEQLHEAEATYREQRCPGTAQALLDAARMTATWTETLVAVDRIDLGWPHDPLDPR
jgi:hypothetical protein